MASAFDDRRSAAEKTKRRNRNALLGCIHDGFSGGPAREGVEVAAEAAGDDDELAHGGCNVPSCEFMRRSGRTRPRWRSNRPSHYVCALCTLLRGASVPATLFMDGRQFPRHSTNAVSPSSRGAKHPIRAVESRRYREPLVLSPSSRSVENSRRRRFVVDRTRQRGCCEQRAATWQASEERRTFQALDLVRVRSSRARASSRKMFVSERLFRSSSVYDSVRPAWERSIR